MANPAPSTALAKRSSDTALMPPPPAPKRIKRPTTVLDEDVYTDALEHIIARDFFPGLLETRAQKEYLEALDSNNSEWIRDAGRKLTQAMTPAPDGRRGRRGTSMTPAVRGTTVGRTPSATPRGWEGATPVRAPPATPGLSEDGEERERKPDVNLDLSLTGFQTKYTSEDNESFNSLLDKQNAKRAGKYAFFHNGNKIAAPRQIAHRAREQKLLQDRQSAAASNALVLRPSVDQDARPASYDSFANRSGPRNTLMFGPDSIEDTHTTTAQIAQDKSTAPPKAVTYTATRLPTTTTTNNSSIPPSPSLSAIDAAIAGRPHETATEPGYSGAETPRVNGYAFVDAEPTPSEMGTPIDDEEAERAEREAAMALMPSVDKEGKNPFKLQTQSKREELHHRLVDKNDAGRRNGGGGSGLASRLDVLRGGVGAVGRTPTPKFASSPAVGMRKAAGNLTPAARMLAARIGGTPGRERSVFDHSSGDKSRSAKRTPVSTPGIKRAD